MGKSWAFPTFGLMGMVEVDMYGDMRIEVGMGWADIGVEASMLVMVDVCLGLIEQCI